MMINEKWERERVGKIKYVRMIAIFKMIMTIMIIMMKRMLMKTVKKIKMMIKSNDEIRYDVRTHKTNISKKSERENKNIKKAKQEDLKEKK